VAFIFYLLEHLLIDPCNEQNERKMIEDERNEDPNNNGLLEVLPQEVDDVSDDFKRENVQIVSVSKIFKEFFSIV
jgi:hypothetical protein